MARRGLVACLLLSPLAGSAAERFEVAAWVDHFDFTGIRDGDRQRFDTETPAGWAAILDHVQETGATTILWRNCGGANLRYDSRVDGHHHDRVLDERRGPDNRYPGGWVRYGDARPDILTEVFRLCAARGLAGGVHWPYEENHWALWTLGDWNLDHPQYWCRSLDGRPWWGRTSLAWPAVFDHKLALVDELIDRRAQVVFLDFWRSGGWSPADEFVEPSLAAWRARYGDEPPDPRDPRWSRLVAERVTDWLREVSRRLHAADPPARLYIGVDLPRPGDDGTIRAHGVDWERWVDEQLIDGLVINFLPWDAADPLESTRRLGRAVTERVAGRCRVLWPVRAYDYSGYGLPSYQKATGLSQDELARRLTTMAWEEGAAGISLECVDYGNYAAATRQALAELTGGACREVRVR